MVILGGWVFLMSEEPLCGDLRQQGRVSSRGVGQRMNRRGGSWIESTSNSAKCILCTTNNSSGMRKPCRVAGFCCEAEAGERQSKSYSGRGLRVKVLKTLKVVPSWLGSGRRGDDPYLTQCINQMGLESQLPYKTVNLSF